MLRRLRDLENWTVESADGSEVGTVEDVFFDDGRWTARYLAVSTGNWLTGRSVLVSPMAFTAVDPERSRFKTDLSRGEIAGAPGVEAVIPISRRYEAAYATHYGYPLYWIGGGLWGPAPTPTTIPRGAPGSEPVSVGDPKDLDRSRLRSVNEVSGYHIPALDGEIGHAEDFLADDETWAIRYIIVDTSKWNGGRAVLISPDWVRRIQWRDRLIHVDVSRESVRNSPEYRPGMDTNREYEDRLYRYYSRPAYWR
jgi:hypothetical protein